MNIENHCVVAIHYTLTDDAGEQLDSSAGQEPLVYLHGHHNIISGLEDALEGKGPGEQVQVTVQPEDGYGHANPDLVQQVPLSAFEGAGEVAPGMVFQAQDSAGNTRRVTVNEVAEDQVTVDANHPLAGKVLHFDISVEDVRSASDDEIAHGHPH